MRRKIVRVVLAVLSTPVLFQAGCLSGTDVRAIAEGQFVSFVNALINASTSDAIRGALGG